LERIPFDIDKEMQIIGEFKSMLPRAPGLPKLNTPITPKENYKLLFEGKRPLWMPSAFDSITLIPRIIPDNIARGFVIDADPLDLKDAGGKDFFGIEWVYVEKVGGSMVQPGNPKVPDITRWEEYIEFPDLDQYDWEGSAARHREFLSPDRMTILWVMNGLFERLISFMDFENAALAIVDDDEKDSVHRLFDALCDFYDKLFEKYKTYYDADIILFHDDWGSQRAPFFSLSTCREMLVPYLSRLVESCHKRGMYLDFHCCGKNEILVPAMIEAGVDAWTPQEMNDRHMIIEKYGDKLNIGVRMVIPMEATEDEVVEIVESFVKEYGGYGNVIGGAFAFGGNQTVIRDTLYSLTRQAYNV
jgi:hypothetical protein